MKLVAVSDTHGFHCHEAFPEIPAADIVVHAGDASMKGTHEELTSFLNWFSSLPHPYKIFVPGNHDIGLDLEYVDEDTFYLPREEREQKQQEAVSKLEALIPDNVTVLRNSFIEIEDRDMTRTLKIYGTPFTPKFYNWAFQRRRGFAIAQEWAAIPDDTDILITHGPAYGHGDLVRPGGMSRYWRNAGCVELLKRLMEVKPLLHIFGHIHEGRGVYTSDEVATMSINAAICTADYAPTNNPITVDLDYL